MGSVRNRSNVNFSVNQGSINYPFGEEIIGTENNREKFATYFRDKDTGLDYARNRYYASTMGRFLTPDPYAGSSQPGIPQSWNRYAYVNSDPIGKNDPSGLNAVYLDGGFLGNLGGSGGVECFVWDFFSDVSQCFGAKYGGLFYYGRDRFCIDTIDMPTSGLAVRLIGVLMGEDSWFLYLKELREYQNGDTLYHPTGDLITRSKVSYEEQLMLQAIANDANFYHRSIDKQITTGRYVGFQSGVANIIDAMFSMSDSKSCDHLRLAIENVNAFLTGNSTVSNTEIRFWSAVTTEKSIAPRVKGDTDIRVGGTDFLDHQPK